ncbi:hypothetical protein [Streptomyces sp. NPDC008139]|uniref:hypothetical protein n=1 Tax=Streptomyces sp. NPDC008139 TaxID=3364814 RepID=UPI0036ECAF69
MAETEGRRAVTIRRIAAEIGYSAPVIHRSRASTGTGEYLMAPSHALTDRIGLPLLDGRPDRRRR